VTAELIDRPKMGFGIPRAAWLRGPLRELTHDLLTDVTARDRGWFNQVAIQEILNSHATGLNRDHLIWPLLAIEVWAREWLDK
jgi:asparagine synthase (glutamine-hydrolysing)